MKPIKSGSIISTSIAIAGTLLSAVSVAQTPLFTVTALKQITTGTEGPGIEATGINATGEVVGGGGEGTQCVQYCVLTWGNANPTILALPPGFAGGYGRSINNSGQVAGNVATTGDVETSQAVVWINGSPTLLLQPAGAPQGSVSEVYHINDSGQAVGSSGLGPTIWNGSTPTVLGPLSGATGGIAQGINDSGVAVGSECCFLNPNGYKTSVAVIWHGTTPQQLPKAPNSQAYAINKSGIVVGQSQNRAVAWANGVATILGGLDNDINAAYAVNDRGIIVGYSKTTADGMHALLWNKIGGAPQDLNTLISAKAHMQIDLQQALGINNNCSIIVNGFIKGDNDQTTAFLLTLTDPSKCANGVL